MQPKVILVGRRYPAMRNLQLIDAVVALHEIARLISEEVGHGQLSDDVRKSADQLHQLSIADSRNTQLTQDIINKAKND
jgi:hypothetical protein